MGGRLLDEGRKVKSYLYCHYVRIFLSADAPIREVLISFPITGISYALHIPHLSDIC